MLTHQSNLNLTRILHRIMGKVASENGHKWIFNRLQDDDDQRKNTQAASILAGGGSPWQASMEAVSKSGLAGFFFFLALLYCIINYTYH